MGLVGAVIEHYAMVMVYGVLAMIIGIASIYTTFQAYGHSGLYWVSAVKHFLVATLAITFARDIRSANYVMGGGLKRMSQTSSVTWSNL